MLGVDGRPFVYSNVYEGATRTPRSVGWHAPSVGPNRGISGALQPLRDRSRSGYRNSPLLRSAIHKNTSNEVGKGFTLLSTCQDDIFRRLSNKMWRISSDQLDPDGVKNFGALVDVCVRARRMSGEVFIRRLRCRQAPTLQVPMQLSILESDLCPVSLNKTISTNHRILQGVEFKNDRRVAYWFYPTHPSDGACYTMTPNDLVRIPASDVIHHYKQVRPGQVRGEPDTVATLLKDRTFHDYDDAELIRKKERSNYTGFLYREQFDEDDFEWDPMTGKPIYEDSKHPESVVSVPVGKMLRGFPGEKMDLFDGDNTGSGYSDFVRWQALQLSAGQDIPYPLLTGDWSGLNDRLVRAFLNEYRRSITFDQTNLSGFQIVFNVWRWWLETAILNGQLYAPNYASDPNFYLSLDIRPDAFKWLHPEQDVNSRQKAVANHLSNIDVEAAEYGRDLDENMRRNAKALKRWQDICREENVEQAGNLMGIFGAEKGHHDEE